MSRLICGGTKDPSVETEDRAKARAKGASNNGRSVEIPVAADQEGRAWLLAIAAGTRRPEYRFAVASRAIGGKFKHGAAPVSPAGYTRSI